MKVAMALTGLVIACWLIALGALGLRLGGLWRDDPEFLQVMREGGPMPPGLLGAWVRREALSMGGRPRLQVGRLAVAHVGLGGQYHPPDGPR